MRTAITGGIGAGKTYVCQLLQQQGIEVYDCDAAAKRLMVSDEGIVGRLKSLIGDAAYNPDGTPCQRVIARFLLKSECNKQRINEIVHPAVVRDFVLSGMEWLESAILFDAHFNERVHFDRIVCVVAPMSLRLQRIISRDGVTKAKAQQWIDSQMSQRELIRHSDAVIINDGRMNLVRQVRKLLEE